MTFANLFLLISCVSFPRFYSQHHSPLVHHQAEVLRRQKSGLQNQHQEALHHMHHPHFGYISNTTLSGLNDGCKFFAKYETTAVVSFQMCVGQQPVDLKNGGQFIILILITISNLPAHHLGMSIINLIQSRGFLPTCRVLHLLLWMQSEVNSENRRDAFVKTK